MNKTQNTAFLTATINDSQNKHADQYISKEYKKWFTYSLWKESAIILICQNLQKSKKYHFVSYMNVSLHPTQLFYHHWITLYLYCLEAKRKM